MSEESKTYEQIVDEGRKFREKVRAIFAEIAGDRAEKLFSHAAYPHDVAKRISEALVDGDRETNAARDIAFHMCDWSDDAAFLVALYLFPEKFSAGEISGGIDRFLCHVPAHVIAAARLNGDSTEDFFANESESKL